MNEQITHMQNSPFIFRIRIATKTKRYKSQLNTEFDLFVANFFQKEIFASLAFLHHYHLHLPSSFVLVNNYHTRDFSSILRSLDLLFSPSPLRGIRDIGGNDDKYQGV